MSLPRVYIHSNIKDDTHLNMLLTNLFPLQKEFSVFAERRIPYGTIDDIAKEEMSQATLFIPLVSADYLSTDSYSKRYSEAVSEYRTRCLAIFPIIIRPCLWEHSNISLFPVLSLVKLKTDNPTMTVEGLWDHVARKVYERVLLEKE